MNARSNNQWGSVESYHVRFHSRVPPASRSKSLAISPRGFRGTGEPWGVVAAELGEIPDLIHPALLVAVLLVQWEIPGEKKLNSCGWRREPA